MTDNWYFIGRYRYNTGEFGIAIEKDVDSLPPTMFEVEKVKGKNKKEALFNWVTELRKFADSDTARYSR